MSKLLQLKNLKRFSSPAFPGIVVEKKQVVRVTDELAAHLQDQGRNNAENEFVPYWEEPSQEAAKTIHHDFTKPAGQQTSKEAVAAEAPAHGRRAPRRSQRAA